MSLRSTLLASEVPLDDLIHCSVYQPTEQSRRIIQSANADKPLRESWLHSTSEDDALFVFRIGQPREEESEQLELDVPPTETRTFSPKEAYESAELWLALAWAQFVSAVTSRVVDDIVLSGPSSSSSSSSSVAVYRMNTHGFVMGHRTVSNEWTVGWEYRAKSRPLVHTHLQLLLSTSLRPSLIIHPILTLTPFLLLPDTPSPPSQGDPLTLLPFGTPAYFLHTYTASTTAVTAQFRDAFRGLGIAIGDWEAGLNSNTQDRGIGKGKGRGEISYVIAYIPLQTRAHGHVDGTEPSDQHDERGLTIIYPSRLCVAFVSPQAAAEAGRTPLPPNKFPVLPAPLQPSPLVPPMLPPGPNSAGVTATGNNAVVANVSTPTAMATPFSPGTPPVSRPANPPGPLRVSTPVGTMTMGPQTATTPLSGRDLTNFGFEFTFSAPSTPFTTQTQHTLKAFRNLVLKRSLSGPTIPKASNSSTGTPHGQGQIHSTSQPSTPAAVGVATAGIGADSRTLHHVAGQVSDYVDAVAKERERERERMRQQQQQNQQATPNSSFSGLRAGLQSQPPTSVPLRSAPIASTQIQVVGTTPATSIPASAPFSMGILSTPTAVSASSSMPGIQIGGLTQQQLQNFYPSPPQCNQTPLNPSIPPRAEMEEKNEIKAKRVPPPLDLKTEESDITFKPPTVLPQSAGMKLNAEDVQEAPQDQEMTEFEQGKAKTEPEAATVETDNINEKDNDATIHPQTNASSNFAGLNDVGIFGGLPGMDMGMGIDMDDMMGMNGLGMMGMNDMGIGMNMDMNWGDMNMGSMNWSLDNTNNSTISSTTVNTMTTQTTLSTTTKTTPSASNPGSSGFTHSRNSSSSTPHPAPSHHSHPTHASHPIVQDFEADFTEDDFDFFDKPAGGINFGVNIVDNHAHLGALASSTSGEGPGPPSSANHHTLPTSSGFSAPVFHSMSNPFHVPSSPTHHSISYSTHMQAHGHPTPISAMPSPWPPGSISHPTPGAAGATPSVQGGIGFLSPGPTPMEEVNGSVEVDVDVHMDDAHELDTGTPANRGRFAPIVFGKTHLEADGKYKDRTGKFSAFTVRSRRMLPSPPWGSDDERDSVRRKNVKNRRNDRHVRIGFKNSKSLPGIRNTVKDNNSWQVEYNHATDPRFRVMKMLSDMRRRAEDPKFIPDVTRDVSQGLKKRSQALGKPPLSPTSIFSDSDLDGDDEDDKTDSDTSSSDNEEDGLDDATTAITDDQPLSRPATPPPSYLPLGPSLLQTGFKYEKLFPFSVPLRGGNDVSTGQSSGQTTAGPMGLTPMSAPTPVSPAAMEDDIENSKIFEAAAEMVAREVVENCVWAEAWGCSDLGRIRSDLERGSEVDTWNKTSRGAMATTRKLWVDLRGQKVWPADIKIVQDLLNGVRGVEGPLSLDRLFDQGPSLPTSLVKSIPGVLYPLEPPMITIGKGDVIIQLIPTALRFWEKLGLGPRGGKKDVTAFVLFEDDGEWRQQQVEIWLSNLAGLYRGKNLGHMLPGRSTFCQKEGLLPLRFDSSFHKTLANFVASLPAPQSSFVFFLVTPTYAMSLTSHLLQSVLSSIKQALKTYSEAQIVFQFIPESLISGSTDVSSPQDMGTAMLCCSIYNRILHPVDRIMSRRLSENGERVRNYFQEPAFTLARMPNENKVTYACRPNASLDVLDRHLLLHVGYRVSRCGKWLLAACVDQRGEAHDVGLWLTGDLVKEQNLSRKGKDLSDEQAVINKVWDFAIQFAEKVNVEWRIAFVKLGEMKRNELDTWSLHLHETLKTLRTVVHVSILCVQTSSPWIFPVENYKSATPHSSLTRTPTSPSVKPQAATLTRSVSASSSKTSRNQIFVDMSTTMYALYQKHPLPLSAHPTLEDLGLAYGVVATAPSKRESPSLPLIPLCSSMLIGSYSMPTTNHPTATAGTIRSGASSATTISFSPAAPTSLHIHLLHVIKSLQCSYPVSESSNRQLHRDITQSYYGLAVLSVERWHLNPGDSLLPFHLAAVDVMNDALSHGEECIGVADFA
ncbi:hypothetical protein K435DRAFT_849922 [Dendrothele bispora CBS 962.96]|uniref:Mediator of RNA polymerase II transcription subunit 13 n=1 Tax=Dendrothele bispora (strain CBS 962.96) TaxID=1314807 RepID=A0A4S8MR07_DENBC|nr:hypothetical protein K435DRAFT_849922 [Dendrothele bispora CBS 962.96]